MNSSRQNHITPVILILLSSLASATVVLGISGQQSTLLLGLSIVCAAGAIFFLLKANRKAVSDKPWMIDPNWLATAIFISDLRGSIVGLNQSCKDMVGEKLDTSSVKSLLEPLHAALEDRSHADDVVKAVLNAPGIQFSDTLKLSDGRTIERITRPLPRDGQRIWKLRDVTDHSLGLQDREMHQTMLEADAARNAELAEQLFHAKAELEANQAELTRLANTDALTGLLNRRRFISKATEIIAVSDKSTDPNTIWVIMLDIDFFKRINDTYGHSAGDTAIRAFADLISECVKDAGFAGRMGGEEFAVALPGCDQNEAFRMAEKVRKRTAELETPLDASILKYTTSVGLAPWMDGEETLEPAIDRADKALYTAKGLGRNRVVGYE